MPLMWRTVVPKTKTVALSCVDFDFLEPRTARVAFTGSSTLVLEPRTARVAFTGSFTTVRVTLAMLISYIYFKVYLS